jgi:hypothetical protein
VDTGTYHNVSESSSTELINIKCLYALACSTNFLNFFISSTVKNLGVEIKIIKLFVLLSDMVYASIILLVAKEFSQDLVASF